MRAPIVAVLVWSAHFAIIYGFTALACARQMIAVIPWVVGAASTAALLALAAVAVPAGVRAARAQSLADFLALGLGVLASIAVVWETSALLWVPPCA